LAGPARISNAAQRRSAGTRSDSHDTPERSTLIAAAWGRSGWSVLDNLSEKIRDCHRHAEECERRAREQIDPGLRQDFLDAAQRWLKLAASYELSERVQRFTHKPRT
jgi:hypothetical protein